MVSVFSSELPSKSLPSNSSTISVLSKKIHPRDSTFSKHNFLVSRMSLNLSISTRTRFLTTSMPYYIIMTPIKQNVSRTVFTRTRFRTNWVIIILIEFTSKMY